MDQRPYNADTDWQALARLLIACKNANTADSLPPFVLRLALTPGSFLAGKYLDPHKDTRVWLSDDGLLCGFALVDLSLWGLLYLIDPQLERAPLEIAIIDWALERAKNQPAEPVKATSLKCKDVREDNIPQQVALESRGFVSTQKPRLRMLRDLNKPISVPPLPAGFTLRHLAAESDIDRYVAMGNSAFPGAFKRENHQELMQVPEFLAELDLVIEAPDGRFVALCQCYFDPCESGRGNKWEGWTDPVGSHPDFRRRGLARAVVAEGMRRLKKHGVARATLIPSESNTGARRLYESLGYQMVYRIYTYEKKLS